MFLVEKYSPEQARDDNGRWTQGSGGRLSAKAVIASEDATKEGTHQSHFRAQRAHLRAANAHLYHASSVGSKASLEDIKTAHAHVRVADTHFKAADHHEKAGIQAFQATQRSTVGQTAWSALEGVGAVAGTVGAVVGAIHGIRALRRGVL